MRNRFQSGSVLSVVSIAFLIMFLIAALGFGGWAYNERADYKNRSDKKAEQAVAAAEEDLKVKLDKEFAEKEKQPTLTYIGPDSYGSVNFSYPKTWSAHIDESGKGNSSLIAYVHPKFVPNLADTSFALRLEVINSQYDQVVKSLEGNIKNGKLTATAYVPDKLKENKSVQPGLRLDGEVATKKQGAMVVIKLRDKTLKIWTESNDYKTDFDKIILPSLTFVP